MFFYPFLVLRWTLSWLHRSQGFIGLCALASGWQSFRHWQVEGQDAYLGLLFCSTVLLYALHRAYSAHRLSALFPLPERLVGIDRPSLGFGLFWAVCLFGALFFLWSLDRSTQGRAYRPPKAAPMRNRPWGRSGRRLRDLPYLKSFWLAFTWAYLCCLLPASLCPTWPSDLLPVFLERSLWIWLLILPLDWRDRPLDQALGSRTIANSLSAPSFARLCLLCGLAWLSLALSVYELNYWPSLLLIGLLYYLFSQKILRQSSSFWGDWGLDALLILQALLWI